MSSDESRRRRLVVSVTDGEGRPLAARGLASWLASIAPKSARGEVSIAIVDDGRVRALNRTYRRKDRVTDVLSFPDGANGVIGDIVIANGLAQRQAREAGHSCRDEIRTLALHGLLHLLGYDHERDQGAMRQEEERLRAKGGLRSGLISRESRRPRARGSGRRAGHHHGRRSTSHSRSGT